VDNSGLIRERDKYREMIRREKIEGVYTGRQKKEKNYLKKRVKLRENSEFCIYICQVCTHQ
jgi:hypothetical protein